MPPKDKRVVIKPLDAAKMPRNPAEDALSRLTLAGDNLFKDQVLARLDPTDRGMLRLVNRDLRLMVQLSGLDRELEASRILGSMEGFEWALKNRILVAAELYPTSAYTKNLVVEAIMKAGNLDMLKRAELVLKHDSPKAWRPRVITRVEIDVAMQFCQMDIIQWLVEHPRDEFYAYRMKSFAFGAAQHGRLDVLKLVKARYDREPPTPREWTLFWDAARTHAWLYGHVEVLEWVLAHGNFTATLEDICNESSVSHLVDRGHFEMLKWWFDKFEADTNRMDAARTRKMFAAKAAARGHLEILKWLVERGFLFDGVGINNGINNAAGSGHLECLVYLKQRGCNVTPTTVKNALESANLHVLRWLIENGSKWEPQLTLDQLENLENIDDPQACSAGYVHHRKVQKGTVHENFGEDLQWIIQRAHQKITDDKLAAEEKQRHKDDKERLKDEKERRAAKKRKAD